MCEIFKAFAQSSEAALGLSQRSTAALSRLSLSQISTAVLSHLKLSQRFTAALSRLSPSHRSTAAIDRFVRHKHYENMHTTAQPPETTWTRRRWPSRGSMWADPRAPGAGRLGNARPKHGSEPSRKRSIFSTQRPRARRSRGAKGRKRAAA
eukprot:365704-Chlamydomonas_euryale.AAC.10